MNNTPADASKVADNFSYILQCPTFTGNRMGLGVTPSAWASAFDSSIDFGPIGALDTISASLDVDIQNNLYGGTPGYVRKTGAWGQIFRMAGNDWQWLQAGSAPAGTVASFATSMRLDFNGNLTILGCINFNSGSSGTCVSDKRVKSNITPFTLGLTQIVGLTPVHYSYNGLGGTPNDVANGDIRTGLLAQDVLKVAPDLVARGQQKLRPTDKNDATLLQVKYSDLTFGLINAVKELKAANDAQLAQLARQAVEIQELRRSITVVERRIAVRTTQNGVELHH